MTRGPSPVGLKNAESGKCTDRTVENADLRYRAVSNDSPCAVKLEKPRMSRKVETTWHDSARADPSSSRNRSCSCRLFSTRPVGRLSSFTGSPSKPRRLGATHWPVADGRSSERRPDENLVLD